MKARQVVLIPLAAAVVLASVAAAAPNATKQRVAISANMAQRSAVLTPLQKGAVGKDSGDFATDHSLIPDRTLIRDGQKIDVYTAVWTFHGKRGTIVFRERNEWADVGADANSDGQPDGIALGTWKVVRGTGAYAGITGSGGSAHEGLGFKWYIRYEGYVTLP